MQESFLDNDFLDFSSPPTERWMKEIHVRFIIMRFGDIENKQEIPMLWGFKKKKDLELEWHWEPTRWESCLQNSEEKSYWIENSMTSF